MTTRLAPGALLVLSLASACAADVSPDVAPCTSDADCGADMRCDGGGACVEADEGCATDLDCGVGASCVDGACLARNAGEGLCTTHADCAITEQCVQGACVALGDGACRVSGQCPADAPLCDTPSSNEVGACVGDAEAPAPSCVEHASVVAGTDTCRCDDGYVANGDQTACVPVRGAEEPPAEEPPAEEPPVSEPPVSEPPEQSPPPEQTPPEQEPEECPPNSSPDPSDPSMCWCDWYYVPDATGTQCVDECEELGWYGDGFFCDACAWPDPDCF